MYLLLSMRLSAGSKLGGYTILEPLGEGGMGEVYVALDPRLRRKVALKTLHAEAASDPGRRERFAHEARTAAALRHPNVVTIYSVEEDEGIPFLTMELLDGGTLSDAIPEKGMTWERFATLATPIAEALATAHARGVVHRDLKPDNIVVERGGPVKVLDFGLAVAADEPADAGSSDRTKTASAESAGGRVVGTLPYMSPEQLEGTLCDARSDVFSLGIVFYEMLTGCRPFKGATPAVVAASILRDPAEPVRRLRPDHPEAVERLVARCLEKDPVRRFDSAGEIAEILRSLRDATKRAAPAPAPEARQAVAILDWVNLGEDEPVEWLATAAAETLAARLRRLADRPVVPRDRLVRSLGSGGVSVLDAAGLARLGERLRARWLVAGGFRLTGTEIRLAAQVADLREGRIVATASASGPLADLIAVQSRAFASIAEAVGLSPDVGALVGSPPTTGVRAYASWAQGRRRLREGGAAASSEARAAFDRAVRLDPAFALAHEDLGRRHLAAHLERGAQDDLDGAMRHLSRAIALDPGAAGARRCHALACALAGRFDEAEASLAAAAEAPASDPEAEEVWYLGLAHAWRVLHGGRSRAGDDAVRALERAAELDPAAAAPLDALGAVELARGRYEAAREAFERASASGGGALGGWAALRLGDPERARIAFARARGTAARDPRPSAAAGEALAWVGEGEAHLQRGRPAEAFEAYKHAVQRIAANPGTPGGGWVQARALLGLAKAAAASGLRREAEAAIARATELLESRSELDFGPQWLGGEAALVFERAVARVGAGDREGALSDLDRAVAHGFGDLRALEAIRARIGG